MNLKKGTSNNVVGYIEGSDPKLKEEAVLFSAHYDAYGIENGTNLITVPLTMHLAQRK